MGDPVFLKSENYVFMIDLLLLFNNCNYSTFESKHNYVKTFGYCHSTVTMPKVQLSEVFSLNFLLLSIFGAWPTVKFQKVHRVYSNIYLILSVFLLYILLTVNLICARSFDIIIRDGITYVTQVVATTKVVMILTKRDDILEAFKLLDVGTFMEDDDCKKRMKNTVLMYKKYHKVYIILCNTVYSTQVVLPLILHGILKTSIMLPFSEFTFLSGEVRDEYFVFWYAYQSVTEYGTMMYEVNIDAIIFGIMFIIISHLKVINYKLINLKIAKTKSEDEMQKLHKILKQYEIVLR